MNIIGAVKINTEVVHSDDTTIGMFSNGTLPAELRWSESELIGVAEEYNYEMIVDNGIGDRQESFDASFGGNTTLVNDFTVIVHGASQFMIRLAIIGIKIHGLTIEYIEFVGTDSDSDSVSSDTIFRGVVEDVEWNENEIRITAKSSYEYKRNRFIGLKPTTTDYPNIDDAMVDNIIPVSFGSSDPDNDRFFKLPRIEYKNETISASDIDPDVEPSNTTIFPLIKFGTEDTREEARFLIGVNSGAGILGYDFTGKYVNVFDGAESSNGEIRKVDHEILTGTIYTEYDSISAELIANGYETDLTDHEHAYLSLCDVFSSYLECFTPDSPTFKTFVTIMDLFFKYIIDSVSCSGISLNGNYYLKDDEEMIKMLDTDTVVSTDNTEHIVEPRVLNSSTGSYDSLVILPVDTIIPFTKGTGENLVEYGIDENYKEIVPGLFYNDHSGDAILNATSPGIITGADYFKDKDRDTEYSFSLFLENTYPIGKYDYYVVFKIGLPEITDKIQFDNIYLGIDSVNTQYKAPSLGTPFYDKFIEIKRKSFYNRLYELEDITYGGAPRNLPDNYYTVQQSTKNVYRYYNGGHIGLQSYDLGISKKEDYESVENLLLCFKVDIPSTLEAMTVLNVTLFKELAIVFEKGLSLGKEVYA